MKTKFTFYGFIAIACLLLTSCTKRDYVVVASQEDQWMQSHEKGQVVYVDHANGNYIVETYQGYSVVEAWSGVSPREYDNEFAFFSSLGTQTTYNYDGNYYAKIRVVDAWLSWEDALYELDYLAGRN